MSLLSFSIPPHMEIDINIDTAPLILGGLQGKCIETVNRNLKEKMGSHPSFSLISVPLYMWSFLNIVTLISKHVPWELQTLLAHYLTMSSNVLALYIKPFTFCVCPTCFSKSVWSTARESRGRDRRPERSSDEQWRHGWSSQVQLQFLRPCKPHARHCYEHFIHRLLLKYHETQTDDVIGSRSHSKRVAELRFKPIAVQLCCMAPRALLSPVYFSGC